MASTAAPKVVIVAAIPDHAAPARSLAARAPTETAAPMPSPPRI